MDGIGIDITDIIGMAFPQPTEEDHSILCDGPAAARFLEDWANDIRNADDELTFRLTLGKVTQGRSMIIEHYHEIFDEARVGKVLSEVKGKSGR